MKKIFKKKNIKYYLIYYLIIELITGFGFSQGIFSFVCNFCKILTKINSFEILIKVIILIIGMLIIFLFSIILMTLPVTIFLLARKSVDITHEMQNKKYTTRKDIIYYREKLDNISPTTISLMKNLKIEEEKDLVATIIKLQLNKNIVIEDDVVKVLSEDVSNLCPSEKRLFYMITGEVIDKNQIESWKTMAIEEAKKQGYIEDKSTSTGLFIKKVFLIILFILFIIGFKHFYTTFIPLVDELENIGINETTEIYEMAENENFEFIIQILYEGVVGIICMVGIFAWPIFYIIYLIRYENKNNSIKRTLKGEQLTDEILGLKRFIHDFTMLNEADKESIVLWDDFIVYAVLLEENEKIIQELLNLKNVRNFDTRRIIKK